MTNPESVAEHQEREEQGKSCQKQQVEVVSTPCIYFEWVYDSVHRESFIPNVFCGYERHDIDQDIVEICQEEAKNQHGKLEQNLSLTAFELTVMSLKPLEVAVSVDDMKDHRQNRDKKDHQSFSNVKLSWIVLKLHDVEDTLQAQWDPYTSMGWVTGEKLPGTDLIEVHQGLRYGILVTWYWA